MIFPGVVADAVSLSIGQLEVLNSHHEDDIVPVILKEQIITGPSP